MVSRTTAPVTIQVRPRHALQASFQLVLGTEVFTTLEFAKVSGGGG